MSLYLSGNFSVFYGENGAGKTSILEAIYYLFTGKSFRTNLATRIINHDSSALLLTASIINEHASTHDNFIGFEKKRNGERLIKLNQQPLSSIADVTKLMPLQVIGVDSYRFFSDGPKRRRSFLDWGVFHVEHSFLSTWQQFNKVLKQRNAALKMKQSLDDIVIWDQQYIPLCIEIDRVRAHYISQFEVVYNKLFAKLLPDYADQVSLRYKRGWNKEADLETILAERYFQDIAFGHTQSGPHRADIQLYIGNTPADDILSQGQQKLAAYALHLAQGVLLREQVGYSPVYLIDDLPSELDKTRQGLIIDILKQLDAQVLITCISEQDLCQLADEEGAQMFHVEHGSITLPELT